MQISKCPICGGKLNSQEQRNKAQIYKDGGYDKLLQKYTILQERYNDLNQRYETIQSKLQISAETRKALMLMKTNQRVQLEQELIKKNREIIQLQKALENANAKISSRNPSAVNSSNTEFTFGQKERKKERIISFSENNFALEECDKPVSIIANMD